MRVLYLTGQLGLGGSERQLYLLLRHLDRRRFDCHVTVFNPSPNLELDDAIRELGVPVRQVPESCRGVARRARFLYRTFRDLAPDVVHSWSLHDNAYAAVAGRLARVPVRLGSMRSALASTEYLPWPLRFLALRGVDALVVNSRSAAAELEARGHPAKRLLALPNCVEAPADPTTPPDLSDLGVGDDEPLIGLVANVKWVKNPMLFVDAMARVLLDRPAAKALIVGQALPSEPDMADRLAARVADLGLAGRILLTGFRADVPDLVRRLDVCCLTSRFEGMPNAILEAMAAGRPIVATRVGGVPELVRDGENGFLVDSDDADGLAGAVGRLLDDPELARRMGDAGRRIAAADHDCAAAARRLEGFYQGLLGGSRGGRAW